MVILSEGTRIRSAGPFGTITIGTIIGIVTQADGTRRYVAETDAGAVYTIRVEDAEEVQPEQPLSRTFESFDAERSLAEAEILAILCALEDRYEVSLSIALECMQGIGQKPSKLRAVQITAML